MRIELTKFVDHQIGSPRMGAQICRSASSRSARGILPRLGGAGCGGVEQPVRPVGDHGRRCRPAMGLVDPRGHPRPVRRRTARRARRVDPGERRHHRLANLVGRIQELAWSAVEKLLPPPGQAPDPVAVTCSPARPPRRRPNCWAHRPTRSPTASPHRRQPWTCRSFRIRRPSCLGRRAPTTWPLSLGKGSVPQAFSPPGRTPTITLWWTIPRRVAHRQMAVAVVAVRGEQTVTSTAVGAFSALGLVFWTGDWPPWSYTMCSRSGEERSSNIVVTRCAHRRSRCLPVFERGPLDLDQHAPRRRRRDGARARIPRSPRRVHRSRRARRSAPGLRGPRSSGLPTAAVRSSPARGRAPFPSTGTRSWAGVQGPGRAPTRRPGRNQFAQPVCQQRVRHVNVTADLVEAPYTVERLTQNENRPFLPDHRERALDRAVVGVDIEPMHLPPASSFPRRVIDSTSLAL